MAGRRQRWTSRASNALRGLLRRTFPSTDAVARWLAGVDDDYRLPYKVPDRPYKTEPWVRKAVACTAAAVSAIPVVVSTIDGDEVEDGPVADAMAMYGGGTFGLLYQIAGHYKLTGEAHLIRGLRGPRENTVDVMGAHGMTALTSDDGYELLGWKATLCGRDGRVREYMLDTASVVSWIDPNLYPGTRFRGCSAIESLALTLAEDHAAGEHNAVLLARGGGPKGYLKTEERLTPEQARALEERYQSRYGGTHNTGGIAVLGQGTEWMSMTQTNRDLMILESRRVARETILAVLDVPPDVAGIQVESSSSGAHTGSTREGWYVNTIWPMAIQIGEMLTKFFVNPSMTGERGRGSSRANVCFRRAVRGYGRRAATSGSSLIIWLDMTQVPAMRTWLNAQADAALKWQAAGVPLNQIIAKNQFVPYEPVPWGDDFWQPRGLTTAAWQLEHLDDDPLNPIQDKPVGDDESIMDDEPKRQAWCTREQADAIWRRYVASFTPLEKRVLADMRRFFFKQREKMLRLAAESVPPQRSAVRAAGFDAIGLDLVRENKALIELITPSTKAGLKLGGDQIARQLGTKNPFRLSDEWFLRLLPERFKKVVEINVTTQTKLRAQMREAFANNETLQEVQARIKAVFKEASNSRALRIARTESAMSVSTGRHVTMKTSGISRKGWLTAGDENVRATHVQAGSAYRKGIPIDGAFIVGGARLMHPNDPAGPAKEIVNCRCVLMPIVDERNWDGDETRFMSLAESEALDKEHINA